MVDLSCTGPSFSRLEELGPWVEFEWLSFLLAVDWKSPRGFRRRCSFLTMQSGCWKPKLPKDGLSADFGQRTQEWDSFSPQASVCYRHRPLGDDPVDPSFRLSETSWGWLRLPRTQNLKRLQRQSNLKTPIWLNSGNVRAVASTVSESLWLLQMWPRRQNCRLE